MQGSNSIEGYHASVEDVAAVLEGEEPLEADEETHHAIAGYRDAMTYVLQLAPSQTAVDASLIKALHFMMLRYDLGENPGQYRPGAVWVQNDSGEAVSHAPDRELVEPLMSEQVEARHRLPDRTVAALCDPARGWRYRRSLYVKITRGATGADVSDAAATRDLSALAAAGLVEAVGEKRGRSYVATPTLRAVWDAIQTARPVPPVGDPYRTARDSIRAP